MKEENFGCFCGATDCSWCGPRQGYKTIKVRRPGQGIVYINPDEDAPPADWDGEDPKDFEGEMNDHWS